MSHKTDAQELRLTQTLFKQILAEIRQECGDTKILGSDRVQAIRNRLKCKVRHIADVAALEGIELTAAKQPKTPKKAAPDPLPLSPPPHTYPHQEQRQRPRQRPRQAQEPEPEPAPVETNGQTYAPPVYVPPELLSRETLAIIKSGRLYSVIANDPSNPAYNDPVMITFGDFRRERDAIVELIAAYEDLKREYEHLKKIR